ncbi:Uncharacterised protein [Clostridioides difficile]|nr:Uncharacterised protein [Clostridioides difficile]
MIDAVFILTKILAIVGPFFKIQLRLLIIVGNAFVATFIIVDVKSPKDCAICEIPALSDPLENCLSKSLKHCIPVSAAFLRGSFSLLYISIPRFLKLSFNIPTLDSNVLDIFAYALETTSACVDIAFKLLVYCSEF